MTHSMETPNPQIIRMHVQKTAKHTQIEHITDRDTITKNATETINKEGGEC